MTISDSEMTLDRLSLLVDASLHAIVVTDERGTIVLVNVSTENLFAYSRAELIGQPVEILVPVHQREHHVALRQQYVREPHSRLLGGTRELMGMRRDGSEFPIEIGLNPIRAATG